MPFRRRYLSAAYLEHRLSEDADIFVVGTRKGLSQLWEVVAAALVRENMEILDTPPLGPERSQTRSRVRVDGEVLTLDLIIETQEQFGEVVSWNGLTVDALLNIAVNKLECIYSRSEVRDYVDLYFILKETRLKMPQIYASLLSRSARDGVEGPTLARQLLEGTRVCEFPAMLKPIDLQDFHRCFRELAQDMMRAGPDARPE